MGMIRRFKAALMLVGFLAVLAGHARAQADTLEKVQLKGVLNACYFLFEPTIMSEASGKPYGLFVDIVEQIAKDLRWKVEYTRVDLKDFQAALSSGRCDLSIGATFSSPNRAGGVAFTEPIFYMGYTGVAMSAKAGQFKKWSDVDQPGVRVAVKQGSAIGDYVARNFKRAKVIALETGPLSESLAAVPGQADVGLMNQITVYTYLRDNAGRGLKEILAKDPVEFTGICWAVRHGDSTWLGFINSSLKHLEDTGRIREWEAKYHIPYMYHSKRMFRYDSGTATGEISR